MQTDQAKEIHMRDLLAALGHEAQREDKGELWYLSPFRQETDASFKITRDGRAWFDHGMGKGGNILDFAMTYFHTDLRGALAQLDGLHIGRTVTVGDPMVQPSLWPLESPQTPVGGQREAPADSSRAAELKSDGDDFSVTKIQPLQNRALIHYLQQRGIDAGIAESWVQEMYYKRNGKSYFALAFANDSGGYELRNPYFKGSQGIKDVTLLQPAGQGDRTVAVFEGFMDFLSWLAHTGAQPDRAVLVMNSVAMRERAVAAIQASGAQEVHLYLDHDASGQELANYMQEALDSIEVVDQSGFYAGYKDVNEWLVAQNRGTARAAGSGRR